MWVIAMYNSYLLCFCTNRLTKQAVTILYTSSFPKHVCTSIFHKVTICIHSSVLTLAQDQTVWSLFLCTGCLFVMVLWSYSVYQSQISWQPGWFPILFGCFSYNQVLSLFVVWRQKCRSYSSWFTIEPAFCRATTTGIVANSLEPN